MYGHASAPDGLAPKQFPSHPYREAPGCLGVVGYDRPVGVVDADDDVFVARSLAGFGRPDRPTVERTPQICGLDVSRYRGRSLHRKALGQAGT